MSKYPQVECCKVVIERRGDDMTYVAKADDWLSLLDDAATGAILHSCAAELATLADTFAPGYDGDSVEATLPPVETQTASAIARRRAGRPPFRIPPRDNPADGGDDDAA